MDRKNIDPLLLNWQWEKFNVEQITEPGDTKENKRAQAFVTQFNDLMDTLDYPGTSAMPFLVPTKNIRRLLTSHFADKRPFDTEQYLEQISSTHRKKPHEVNDEQEVANLHDRAREGDEDARRELVGMDQNNPIEIDDFSDFQVSDEHRQMAREAGLDPDSLVLNRGDIYALSFPHDTKKCGVFRLSRQKGRKLRKNVMEMYGLAGLPQFNKWFEFAKRNDATSNQFHQTMMSLTRMYVSTRVYSDARWNKNKAWEFILRVRYRTHQQVRFVGIDGLRDGYAQAEDRTFEGWANFQCEPFQVDINDFVQTRNEIKRAAPNLKQEKQDVLKRIFTPLNEMWNRIRRMGVKNTAQWMEQSKTRRHHKTWVKIGNNKSGHRVSKAFEDVPEDFQQDLRHSQKTCRKGRQQRKFDQLRGSLQRLHGRGVRMAQLRDWLFEPQDVKQMDDDDEKVVVRLRSNFRRFKPQTDEKLKRRMIRLGLPEFRAHQIQNDQDRDSVDPFRLGRRRKRKPKTEQLQVQGPTTKFKPLEVHSNKWKGTTDKWLQIPLLELSKTFSVKLRSGS
jgi:hypothetical protein